MAKAGHYHEKLRSAFNVAKVSIYKVVICVKYKNLNKITKNLTYIPEFKHTSYFCYSLQFTVQKEGHAVYKSVLIQKDQREILCAKI